MANIAANTRRGFTGHDMLDNLRLIHMNGRVLDPLNGRFISADPFIDGAGSTQGWNRYSYAGNNPLSFSDPTGYGSVRPDGGQSLHESIFDQLDTGSVDPDDSGFNNLGLGSGAMDYWFNALLSWTRMDRSDMLDTISRLSRVPHRNSVSLPKPTPAPDGAPMPKQQVNAAPAQGSSTVGGFANDGVMNPIYVPAGTVAMNLPNFVYQQCAMSMCHGNTDLPFTHGYLDDEQSQNLAIEAGITVFGWPIGGARLIPWSSRAVRAAVEALEVGATEVRVGSRSEAAELFLGRYQGAGYRNTTGWSPREVKDFFGSKAGTYHWDEGLNAFPHDASHLQIHTLEGPVIRIYFPD